jgi:hypothetical protein
MIAVAATIGAATPADAFGIGDCFSWAATTRAAVKGFFSDGFVGCFGMGAVDVVTFALAFTDALWTLFFSQ